MDISKINGHTPPRHVHKGKGGSEKSFDEILSNAVDTVAPGERDANDVGPVREVALDASWRLRQADHVLFEHAQTILDLLEQYCEGLKNPQMTLKGIEPVVSRIANELSKLDIQSLDSMGQDHEFARIINEIAVTANVETFKFQRGDYIP